MCDKHSKAGDPAVGSTRLVGLFLPRLHHQSGYPKQKARVEYWPGDDRWRSSLHLHWNWRGRAHWLCIFMPEWPWPNGRDERQPTGE